MTPTELRALDLEMALFMEWKEVRWQDVDRAGVFSRNEDGGIFIHVQRNEVRTWQPSLLPADAMMVLKKVSIDREVIINCIEDDCYFVGLAKESADYTSLFYEDNTKSAPTLELAICLFAREVGR